MGIIFTRMMERAFSLSSILLIVTVSSVFCYERCNVRNTQLKSACHCRKGEFEDFSSSCEIFRKPKKGLVPWAADWSCKSNVSQECKDGILFVAKLWRDAPNASTCKNEDPDYNMIMEFAKSCSIKL